MEKLSNYAMKSSKSLQEIRKILFNPMNFPWGFSSAELHNQQLTTGLIVKCFMSTSSNFTRMLFHLCLFIYLLPKLLIMNRTLVSLISTAIKYAAAISIHWQIFTVFTSAWIDISNFHYPSFQSQVHVTEKFLWCFLGLWSLIHGTVRDERGKNAFFCGKNYAIVHWKKNCCNGTRKTGRSRHHFNIFFAALRIFETRERKNKHRTAKDYRIR